jgi:hypothetical protein
MKIVFGSQTGTATFCSQELAKEAGEHNWKVSVVDLKDYNPVREVPRLYWTFYRNSVVGS